VLFDKTNHKRNNLKGQAESTRTPDLPLFAVTQKLFDVIELSCAESEVAAPFQS
jgi:hypothetical protein